MLSPLRWNVTRRTGFAVAAFEIVGADGIFVPERLADVELPADALGRETEGIVFSGRGPVWLYALLSHLAHPFAWVGVHDPRLGGAVVVERHRNDAPRVGEVVPFAPQGG